MMNKENIEQILKMQDENYANRIGTTFGIFRIDDVKYNWITHTQEWVVSCMKCNYSETVPKSIGRDWLRGKGRNQYKCKHCKEIEYEQRKAERERFENEKNSLVGEKINGWIVNERKNSMFLCNCSVCGRARELSYAAIVKDQVKCKMCNKTDFSDSAFIGKRYGSLTIIGYNHGNFNVRCDCGFEKTVKCNNIINKKTMTCGRHECEYHKQTMNYYGKYGELVREVGENTEKEICDRLTAMGYVVERTPSSGDYGVDLIFTCNNGDRAAIQIKNNQKTKQKTGVHAIQEVFSGGLFYDCNKFVVISYTGYTDNAIKIANKLGVMLCDENFRLFEKPNYHFNTKHFWNVNGVYEPMSVTFRREGWDNSHCERFYNMTYEQVKELQKNREIRKSQVQYCKEHNLSLQYIEYRMKTMGMTFEQAVSEPKRTMGRPRKQGVAV